MEDLISSNLSLAVGTCYRSKKPRSVGLFSRLVDDRQIVWLGIDQVQYDSPTVKRGRKFPIVSRGAFLKWAGKVVELPNGEWADFDEVFKR
jgi:hypothetical protein